MRYDDIEVHRNIVNDTIEIIEKQDLISKRMSSLANNENIKFLNFKVIAASFAAGLAVGIFGLFVYIEFVPKKIITKKIISEKILYKNYFIEKNNNTYFRFHNENPFKQDGDYYLIKVEK